MSKKSFNLSLQKKRNQLVLNPIIERCEGDGSYVADKVVDYVEKALFFERSIGLSKALNTYVLVKNTLQSQYPADSPELQQRVEDVMRSIISVDGERLAQFLSDPDSYSNGAGTLPASESRTPLRSASPAPAPAPQPQAERQEVERSQASTATAVAEPKEDTAESEHQRKAEEKAKAREQARKERRLAEQQASEATQEEEDEDNEGIDINSDAIHNF